MRWFGGRGGEGREGFKRDAGSIPAVAGERMNRRKGSLGSSVAKRQEEEVVVVVECIGAESDRFDGKRTSRWPSDINAS